jgi:hypothetical protein
MVAGWRTARTAAPIKIGGAASVTQGWARSTASEV